MFRPDVFETTMDIVVDKIDSPSRRISRDREHIVVLESDHRCAKLLRFPRFNLCFAFFNT